MKKILIMLMCFGLSMVCSAQLKKVTITKAEASGSYSSNPPSNAIDGNVSTLWHSPYGSSGSTTFPVTFTIHFANKDTKVDIVRYVPRSDGSNGNWDEVLVEYDNSFSASITKWKEYKTYKLNRSGNPYDFDFSSDDLKVRKIRFTIKSGAENLASAAEIEAYVIDNSKQEAFAPYFSDALFTELKPEVTSSEGIEDADVKTLVDNLLADKEEYSKFRVGEYEPYRTLSSLQKEFKSSSTYNPWENPTGIYLEKGDVCYVAVDGIVDEKVGLSIKTWCGYQTGTNEKGEPTYQQTEEGSSYSLRNGLNMITATTEGNVFVDYFTDNYETASNVRMHFVNAPVRGYWDQKTMTNEDWKTMLSVLPDDNSIIIVRSEHAQLAYPVSAWKKHCPVNVDSLMTLYQQVQWAERDIMGLEKYGRQTKNRQLYYATVYGFMAAGGHGAYCHIGSLGAIMAPDSKKFDFWGVGHEWGHNNQITPGFKWSGCGETTNNIYASWAQIHFTGNPSSLRLEDEISGIDEYSNMRGGRMQTYFEEALRKGVQWQLQDGPDYHGATPETKTVVGYDHNGNSIGQVTTTSRNYDHFVKLVPFWQLNLWGTLAGKCPDIIPMIIESIRTTDSYGSKFNTNGKQQVNWMKLACDSAKINLLPFFEKAGMLKPISAYIEDYSAGWNIIDESMISTLEKHVISKGYPAFTEEINYINGHNYHIYRDNLKLEVPGTMGTGCTLIGNKVKVMHNSVKNAVAFETYNYQDSLIRITMYGLGADDAHSYTQVLYPSSYEEKDASAYIVAVGFDGTRKTIYVNDNYKKGLDANKFYTFVSKNKGKALSCGTNTSVNQSGTVSWSLSREATPSSINAIWFLKKKDGKLYLYNPQSNSYFTGTAKTKTTSLCSESSAPAWDISYDENNATCTFNMSGTDQYINSYTETETGLYSGGSSDANNIWSVEEVNSITISVPSTGYYLGYYPFALDMPDGMQAFVVGEVLTMKYNETDYEYAVLDPIKGGIVPAFTPAVYVGEAGKDYTVSLTPNYDLSCDAVNLLHGTTLKKTGFSTSVSPLYKVESTQDAGASAILRTIFNTKELVPNSSYLLKSEVGNKSKLYLQTRDFITGISDIKGAVQDTEEIHYELNGTRAGKLQSGRVYVTSTGKTILVR
ncbi:MAG: M60 family metallopeptidase [Bacteroidaceae bacterium]|nr:M60 family metallopeptidase [Bacteroidaceae bacterium]